jgi:hypothetical protein
MSSAFNNSSSSLSSVDAARPWKNMRTVCFISSIFCLSSSFSFSSSLRLQNRNVVMMISGAMRVRLNARGCVLALNLLVGLLAQARYQHDVRVILCL